MASKFDLSYINRNGKRVSGSAAFIHHVFTEKDGIQSYNDGVGREYIAEFIHKCSDIINDRLIKKARKSRFKVV